MGVASWPCVVWIVDGSGPAGGLPLRKGWAADRVSWVCSRGWLVCPVIGVGDTPVMLLLPACVGSGAWWVPSRAFGAWGWHAVGVLGQCALVARPVWGSWLSGGSGWVWVGWL